jgi:DNA repair photolyase
MRTIDRTLDIRLKALEEKSSYQSYFNWDRFHLFHKTHSIEISKKNGIELINSFVGCENCHVGFQLDTFLEGCTHDCKYCYAKIEGEAKNNWNNPVPRPLDFTFLWEAFYKVFEEKKRDHELYRFLSKKVPLRLGSLSDPFLSIEKQLEITKEVLLLLNHYDYPYLIVTRSSLISKEPYLSILRKDLASVHISIPSLDAEKTKILEPRAPNPLSRLQTIRELREKKIWVTARVNPLFPVFQDGELLTGKNLNEGTKNNFNFYTDELIEEISKTGCKSILVGFVTLKSRILNELSLDLKFPLRSLMKSGQDQGDFKFSSKEIRKYFEHIKKLSTKLNMQFTTCYLGQNSAQFYSNQDLWDNKRDCCNSLGVVEKHMTTSLAVPRHLSVSTQMKGKGFFQKIILKLMSFILRELEDKK